MTKVFCDMDGVLADFVGGAFKWHKRPSPYTKPEAMGIFDIEKLWGISQEEFWAPIDHYEFWRGLEKTPEADELVELLFSKFGKNNVCVLTAPSKSADCFTGKRAWLEEHFPEFGKRIIFGSAKEFLAGPDRVLVDDRDRNIVDFRKAGGKGVLVPRDWNSAHYFQRDVMKIIKDALYREGY